eukprot:CAMPEP_0117526998 /NCGR_PEP_ID=MMETSP0784-20121206/36572_1 /TAXON_ID=39447 /ORGANISM="" /LENGTH=668 /DNA_ID=CAMNT_0005323239 /DNA_START=63 /DNA_END=2069 /DNA_ORIENTATION=-
MTNTVWVSNLPPNVQREALAELFASRCGEVKSATIRRFEKEVGASVRFTDAMGFEKALSMSDAIDLDDFSLKVAVRPPPVAEIGRELVDGAGLFRSVLEETRRSTGGVKLPDANGGVEQRRRGGRVEGKSADDSAAAHNDQKWSDSGSGNCTSSTWWGRSADRDWQSGWHGKRWQETAAWSSDKWHQDARGQNQARNKDGQGTPSNGVYVGKLPKGITHGELEREFKRFGEIVSVAVRSKNGNDFFGFVNYHKVRHAQAAVDKMHRSKAFGEPINVMFSKHKAPEERRKNDDDVEKNAGGHRPALVLRPRNDALAEAGHREEDGEREVQLTTRRSSGARTGARQEARGGDEDATVDRDEGSSSSSSSSSAGASASNGGRCNVKSTKARAKNRAKAPAKPNAGGTSKRPRADAEKLVHCAKRAREADSPRKVNASNRCLVDDRNEDRSRARKSKERKRQLAAEVALAAADAMPAPPRKAASTQENRPNSAPRARDGRRDERLHERDGSRLGRNVPRSGDQADKADRVKQPDGRGVESASRRRGTDQNGRQVRSRSRSSRARGDTQRSLKSCAERVGTEPKEASATKSATQKLVRIDHLPSDMTLDEFRSTAEDFGEVVDAKISKRILDGARSGVIAYRKEQDIELALKKLDRRRVEGWDQRLRAYLVEE